MTTTAFPKIDLHLHLDGSLSIPFLKSLALENGLTMTDSEVRNAVTVSSSCQSLPEYLRCFDLPTRLLQTEKSLTLATFDVIQQLENPGPFLCGTAFCTAALHQTWTDTAADGRCRPQRRKHGKAGKP